MPDRRALAAMLRIDCETARGAEMRPEPTVRRATETQAVTVATSDFLPCLTARHPRVRSVRLAV
jgi:hypothetical protein